MAVITLVLTSLAVLTSFACTVLLLRAHQRQRNRLLLWSGLCFVCLTVNNVLLFLDLIVLPDFDLRPYRLIAALVGIALLLHAFIWEAE